MSKTCMLQVSGAITVYLSGGWATSEVATLGSGGR